MSKITIWFIKSAIAYFVAAMLLGIYMTIAGPIPPFMQIHTHFNLLGWMSMMVYGVGYHILPRFSGNPLFSERLATAQLYLANIGLLGMAGGWIVQYNGHGFGMLHGFSIIEGISIVIFAINMFKTIKSAPPIKKG